MSNKNQLSLIAIQSFEFADRVTASEFDYGDGALQRKRIAIALNQIARAAEGMGLKEMWTSNMLDDNGKKQIIKGLKDKPTKDADDALHEVWEHLDEEHKQMHFEHHPESRHKVVEDHNDAAHQQHAETEVAEQQQHEEVNEELRTRHKRRNRNKRVRERNAGTEDDDDSWWNKMSMSEQKKYLRDHPKSKKARRWRIGIRNMAMKATKPIHHEIRKMGHTYRTGMDGIRALRSGRKMNDEQKEALKNVAKRMSKLLMGALAGAALFTPLGPFAMELGDKYADEVQRGNRNLNTDHQTRRRLRDGTEVDEDGNPTTVGQTNGNGNQSGSPTTVGQTEPARSESGVNLKMSKKKHAEHQQNETELEWMRRDMTEWLISEHHALEKEFTKRSKR
jgi:hypothetical protein